MNFVVDQAKSAVNVHVGANLFPEGIQIAITFTTLRTTADLADGKPDDDVFTVYMTPESAAGLGQLLVESAAKSIVEAKRRGFVAK